MALMLWIIWSVSYSPYGIPIVKGLYWGRQTRNLKNVAGIVGIYACVLVSH